MPIRESEDILILREQIKKLQEELVIKKYQLEVLQSLDKKQRKEQNSFIMNRDGGKHEKYK